MSINIRKTQHPRRDHGFSLVEALVALLALSIGLLGVAGLQLTGMRASQSSAWRSQATYLSYDIIERMRLNTTNRRVYEVGLGDGPTPVDRATNDIDEWKGRLAAALPLGDGTIDLSGTDDNVVTITVQWADARGDNTGVADDTPLVFTMQSRL